MWVYILRRLLWTPFLLLAVSFITFALGRFGPGDPLQVLMGQYNNPEAVERIRHEQGLDKPFMVQYGIYIKNAFQGDLGESYQYRGRGVGELIGKRMLVSAQLSIAAMIISLGLGIPLGGTMCGHGIIGLVTVMLEQGLFPASVPTTTIRFDTPSGLVTARASLDAGKVRNVAFLNVPSFVLAVEQTIKVPGIGSVDYDVAFGGAFYAFCRAEALGLTLEPKQAGRLQALGLAIKQAIMAERTISHPTEPELGYLYGTIFVGPPRTPEGDLRQVCIFANGALDRSPTGTGVSAHLALLHAKGNLRVGQALRFESILGTRFGGKIVEETQLGPYPAIIPEIEGHACLTGRHEFMIDPDDPLKDGFLLG
jgi:trans-L-3-hydroxyproline dehydratase